MLFPANVFQATRSLLHLPSLILSLVAITAAPYAAAFELDIQLNDKHGNLAKIQGAVAYLTPTFDIPDTAQAMPHSVRDIAQENRKFTPQISVIRKSGTLRFPNKDNVNHHVYSFSKPLAFELPLYKGSNVPELKAINAGEVILGCNIHDWMIGYLLIVDTPFYQQNESANWHFSDLPPGEYELAIWHPQINKQEALTQKIALTENTTLNLNLKLELSRLKSQSPPQKSVDEDDYF